MSAAVRRTPAAAVPCPTRPTPLPADRLAELLGRAGFTVAAHLVQEPDEDLDRKIAGLPARRPAPQVSGVAP